MLTEKELGARLRACRAARGISQEGLAAMMGTHQGLISSLETGTHYPKLEILFRFCEAVGVPASTILAESPPPGKEMLSPEEIGVNIRKWRILRGLGIKELAKKSGVSRDCITDLEHGSRSSMLLTYWYIAKALGIRLGDLLGETEGSTP